MLSTRQLLGCAPLGVPAEPGINCSLMLVFRTALMVLAQASLVS